MITYILTDIEGTTSDISFVKDVLFPYAAKHLPNYIREYQNQSAVQEQLSLVAADSKLAVGNIEALIETLLTWIKLDLKKTPLKALQGQVWRYGYEQHHFKGHLYEDAYQCLTKWKQQGFQLGVYSSGSVEAQKLLFSHSIFGDLTPLFSNYYDTRIGHKRELVAYEKIIDDLKQLRFIDEASNVLFLSDVVEELDAAQSSGMQTIELRRDEQLGSSIHQSVASFKEVDRNLPPFT